MLVTQLGLLATGIGCSFAPNLIVYTVIRSLQYFFSGVGYNVAFCYVVEIMSAKWRTIFGIGIAAPYSIGCMILSGLAYNWRNWRELQFVMALCFIPFVLIWIFIPESPRWLLAKNETRKAIKICENMARKNGNELPENIWVIASQSLENEDESESQYSFIELFRRPMMRIITINLMFVWFSVSMVYFGLSLNVANLSGNDYINNVISAAMELISLPIVILTLDRYGRKPNISISLILSGISCLCATLTNYYADGNEDLLALGTAFAMLGKLGASASYATIYNYTAELYPTVVRSTGLGITSMSAFVGSIFTPFTIQLQFSVPWITGTIFGVLSLLAGLTSLAFPETMGVKMLTTIEEAEEFYRSSKNNRLSEAENCHENESFKADETVSTAL